MSESDYWPIDLLDNIPRTPKMILDEQAMALGPKTKHVVEARVRTSSDEEGDLHHYFQLVCRDLSNYHYTLFSIWHSLELYPVHSEEDPKKELKDEQELRAYLKSVLQSPRTLKLVRALVAQTRSSSAVSDPDDVPF